MTSRLLLATRNTKKLAELRRILDAALRAAGRGGGSSGRGGGSSGPGAGSCAVQLIGLADVPDYPEVPETGLTFGENALLKAREGARRTGLPTVADDSGLAVDALGGMPGVFSARWAGRHGDDRANLELLLAQLSDVPDEHRGASFVCAAALVLPVGGSLVLPSSASPAGGPSTGAGGDPGGEQVGGRSATEHLVDGRQTGRLLRAPRGDGGFGYDPIFVADGQVRSNAELNPAEKDAISHRGKAFRALAQVIARSLR